MYKTEEEKFWASEFGEGYIERNQGNLQIEIAFFHQTLRRTGKISSFLELGANIGNNLNAINVLFPKARIDAVEINKSAYSILSKKPFLANTYNTSILDFETDDRYDLTFTKGVLIHIAPSELDTCYEKLYTLSNRYILLAEYYNPTPVEVEYHGQSGKLYKRDFCGELMDKYPDLTLIDYGFTYRRDHNFPDDNVNWFLLEK